MFNKRTSMNRIATGILGALVISAFGSGGSAVAPPIPKPPCIFSIGITPTGTTLTYSDGRVETATDGLIRPDVIVCPPDRGGPDPAPTPPPPPPPPGNPPPSDPPPVGDPVTPPIAGIPAPCPASTGPSATGLCGLPRVWKFILNGYDYTPDNEYQPFMRDGQMWVGVEMPFMSKLGLYINPELPLGDSSYMMGKHSKLVWLTTLGPAWRDMIMTPNFTWRNGERRTATGYYSPDDSRFFIPLKALSDYFLADSKADTQSRIVRIEVPSYSQPMGIAESCLFQNYRDHCPEDQFIYPVGMTGMTVGVAETIEALLVLSWEKNRNKPPQEIIGGDVAQLNHYGKKYGPEPMGAPEMVIEASHDLDTAGPHR